MGNRFADNIRKIRRENHLSQEELAEELGVSRQAISKWESGVAYPEMDKIIQLCEKFHVNIDDLLHRDIKEVKGEEETQNNLNKYLDSFLNFITDTISLFSSMNFISKIKCLFEQVVIGGVFFCLFCLLYVVLGTILTNIFSGILPRALYLALGSFLEGIFLLFGFSFSILILVHIFKIRYLDYYNKIKKESMDSGMSDGEEKKNLGEERGSADTSSKRKIFFRRRERSIIIRDPKHSEYKFIKGLLKVSLFIIKICAFCSFLFFSFVLVFLFCLLVSSFMISKTGIFFFGVVGVILSSSIIDIILLLVFYNFVFNRKNDKKKMIWTFLISLILFGASCGFLIIGTFQFDVLEDNYDQYVLKSFSLDMRDDLFIDNHEVRYVEADIPNVKVEYSSYPLCDAEYSDYYDGIYIYGYCSNPLALSRDFIKNVNSYKFVDISNDVLDIVVYASFANISKLKENRENFLGEQRENDYLKSLLDEKNDLIREYEDEISTLKEKVAILEEGE